MTAPMKVEFNFDFGSPNAYLAELVLHEIERRTGVKFDYVPVLLGGIYKATGNMSPAESLRGIKNKPEYNALETERFLRRHKITAFRFNPFFPVNTLALMRGVVAAGFEGLFESYFRAAYHHMWVEPKKMDDPQVFREAFLSSDIDIDRIIARAQQDDVKKKLIENTGDAVARARSDRRPSLSATRSSSERIACARWRKRLSRNSRRSGERRPDLNASTPKRAPRAGAGRFR